jgi:hypothetical protein
MSDEGGKGIEKKRLLAPSPLFEELRGVMF